ncbi:MAG: DUF1573 domain-containing protein [Saprospiraceae bacterium]|nr:DUF1573 domain-containing protein [Saprospiraceae bacterium]
MRTLLMTGFFLMMLHSVAGQEIEWIPGTEIDLGKLEVRSDTEFSFSFLNKSTAPLVIETIRTSCGCTNPRWPSGAIAPGETGEIMVTFTPNHEGFHRKKLKVFFVGTRKGHSLWIEAEAH